MKVLFVLKEEDPIDPMNVQLLSALAKREGHDTFLNVLQHKDLERDLRRIRPDIVAYSGKTGEHKTLFAANRAVKETLGDSVLTIMGGPHPTFNHAGIRLLGEERGEDSRLDALCLGEGDDAWVDVLKAGRSLDGIPNIVTRTHRRPELRDRRTALDDLPFLDRELVYDKTFLGGFPMRSFMAGRGCPFRCTYCFNYDWNRTYREQGKMKKLHNRYSVDRLIEEVEHMRRVESERGYEPAQFIKFYDDMFEFRASPWLEEFAEKWPKRVGLPFFCLVRCDIFAHENADGSVDMREDVLLLLKKAGLASISMSIEAGNRFIRENILVRDMTDKEIRAAFGLMKKHRIATFANTILGVPAPVVPVPGCENFDARLIKAIRETKLAFTVAKKSVERGAKGGAGYPRELDEILGKLEKGEKADTGRAVSVLENLGLKSDPIQYDLESVELNIACGVDHTMFPRLDPYPGTVITDYTQAIGAFDGDYEKLHSSYDTTSSFTCFDDKQKLVQDNLSFLGQVCALLPWLWPMTKRVLIYLPLTRLYWLMFLAAKTWVIKYRIYPMKLSPLRGLRSAYRVLLVEYKKFFQGKANATLGGR